MATGVWTAPAMPQARVPMSPKCGGNRPINSMVVARYPPTPMSAVIRSASYEAVGPRGLSPGAPMAPLPMYHSAGLASPPLSHRSGMVDSARGAPRVQAVPGRIASRSPPPPQRSATEASLTRVPSRHATPRALIEPVATRADMRVNIPVHPMQVAGSGVHSAQSLPGAPGLGSGPLTGPMLPPGAPPQHAMPAARAMSASALPSARRSLTGGSSTITVPVQTLTPAAKQPPWAAVLAPVARVDSDDLREKLDQIQQEVRTMSLRQLEQGTGDLESTRQRLSEMVKQRLSQQGPAAEKEPKEPKRDEKMEELCAQLAQRDERLREVEQRLAQTVHELGQTTSSLERVRDEYDGILASKQQLESAQLRSREHSDAAAEQLRQRVQDLERSELDLQERVRVLTSMKSSLEAQANEKAAEHGERERRHAETARRMEGEHRLLEARSEKLASELEQAHSQLAQHQEALGRHQEALGRHMEVEQETRELRCCTAVLEDQLRDAQEQRKRAEQARDRAEQARASAEQEREAAELNQARAEQEQQRAEDNVREWYQKFLDANKENTALQRTNQAQVKHLWELENQLRQERSTANICAPGELLRLTKAHEDSSLALENSKLKKVVSKLQCEVDLFAKRVGEQDKLLKECGYQEGTKHYQG